MNVDAYGQVKFNTQEVLESIYNSADSIVDYIDSQHEIDCHTQHCDVFEIDKLQPSIQPQTDIVEYHHEKARNWIMPENYKTMNIEEHLAEKLLEYKLTDEKYVQTLSDELAEYRARNMMDLLKFLKYLMDTCQEHDIVTGVGRGSSVSSLVLYLIGIHAIDPIKYNLDYKEFLR
jgi:DNA polymerase III alpha subunit